VDHSSQDINMTIITILEFDTQKLIIKIIIIIMMMMRTKENLKNRGY